MKKDSLFVTFSGIIESGVLDNFKSLSLSFSIVAGSDWKRMAGERAGQTQIGSCKDEKIVWNYPFEIAFETTVLGGWPQLIVVLYDTDFFGKPYVQGYGNIHLPTHGGPQTRRMRLFCPKPRSVISGILGYFQGFIAEYRDSERVLAYGDGREVTRTKTVGYIDIKIETTKYNFGKFGYE
jgi:B9 domain-containing protein 1